MVSSLYTEVPGEPPFEVTLDRDVVSVGRAEENVLGLRDMNVSRTHFSIERSPVGWLLRDRGSRNGTVVNREVVREKILRDGDRIEVGGSALTFRAQASRLAITLAQAPRPRPGPLPRESSVSPSLGAAEPSRPPPPVATGLVPVASFGTSPGPGTVAPAGTGTPSPALARPTPQPLARPTGRPSPPTAPGIPTFGNLAPLELRPISPDEPTLKNFDPPRLTGRPTSSRPNLTGRLDGSTPGQTPGTAIPKPPGRDRWKKLAELTAAINQERDLDRLLERIVDAILSLVPARGAFLVTTSGDKLELKIARNLERAKIEKSASDDGEDAGFRLSWQICKDAIATKRPVLTQDASSDVELGGFASVANLRLRALLCVPFGFAGQVLGVVYLDEPTIDPTDKNGDVIELVAAFGDLAGIAFANARHVDEVRKRERLAEELRIASRIQRKLLPETAPQAPGLVIAGRMVPAEQVGGDLYDFFGDPERELFISVGDVSGKGAGAGIVMASARALLRAYAEREERTDRLLVAVNRALVRDLEPGNFVSLIMLRYSAPTRTLCYAGAGHEHLIILRARTGQTESRRSGGVVLGVSPNLEGRIEERVLDLEVGDLVVLYTDGATEAASPEGEELGLERLEAIVREARGRTPAQVVDHVIARVQEFAGEGHPPRDDLTVVALLRT